MIRRFLNNCLCRHLRNWRYGPPFEGRITPQIEDWAKLELAKLTTSVELAKYGAEQWREKNQAIEHKRNDDKDDKD